MKNLIIFPFLLTCFFVFSQQYKLDIIYEKSDNNSYKIKNYSNTIIGFLRFNSINKKEFRYFNINNELVGKELLSIDYEYGMSLFDLKTSTEVLSFSGEPIYTRFWDEEQGRFNIFLDGESLGYLKNNKSKNQWEFFKNIDLKINAYTSIFKIKSKPKSNTIVNKSNNFKYIPPNKEKNYITPTKKIKTKRIRVTKNRNRYGTSLSLSENNGIRFGSDFFNGDYSLGLTIRVAPAELIYDEPVSDWDLGMTYGTGILNNFAFVKFGLGFYTYNYDIMESFGPFYEIGYTVYYSVGLQLYINLGSNGITPEIYYNNMGVGYGVGFAF